MLKLWKSKIFTYLFGTDVVDIVRENVRNSKKFIAEFLKFVNRINWDIVFNRFERICTERDFKVEDLVGVTYEILRSQFRYECTKCVELRDYFVFNVITLVRDFLKPVLFGEVEGVKTHILALPMCIFVEISIIKDVLPTPLIVTVPTYGHTLCISFEGISYGPSIILVFPCVFYALDDRAYVPTLLHEYTHHVLMLLNTNLIHEEPSVLIDFFAEALAEEYTYFRRFTYSFSDVVNANTNFLDQIQRIGVEALKICNEDIKCIVDELAKRNIVSLDVIESRKFEILKQIEEEYHERKLPFVAIFDLLKEHCVKKIPGMKYVCTVQEIKI